MKISDMLDLRDLTSSLASVATLAVMFLFAGFSKSFKVWLEKKVNQKFENSINKSSLVRDNLAELRAIMDASRVLLFQIHNGQYYFSGEGADKLSLTHFVVESGVAVPERAGTRLQNIPITYWPETFKEMRDKGFFLSSTSDIVDPFSAQMFSLNGVHSAVFGPVKDRRGLWRGVVVIEYLESKDSVDLTCATNYGQKLGDLLSL